VKITAGTSSSFSNSSKPLPPGISTSRKRTSGDALWMALNGFVGVRRFRDDFDLAMHFQQPAQCAPRQPFVVNDQCSQDGKPLE